VNKSPEQERVEYVFGPFCLHLMPGWSGSFEDGVHTLESEDTETAIQISGFERDAPVEMADLYGLVPEASDGLTRFSLASGLDGFGWTEAEDGSGHRVFRSASVVLAIRVLYAKDASDIDQEAVEAMIGSLARN
jgi:hypothetical protein